MQPLCRLVGVARSGYYAWVKRSPSQRARDDVRLLGLIHESHEASGRTYGAPRILCDLREVGERVGGNRIAKLMKRHKIRAQRGYTQPDVRYTKPAVATPNRLQQQFTIDQAGSGVGNRQHVYSDLRRVAVSGGSDGSLFSPNHRLVDEGHVGEGDCAGCPPDGCMATPAQAGRHYPLRSRIAV